MHLVQGGLSDTRADRARFQAKILIQFRDNASGRCVRLQTSPGKVTTGAKIIVPTPFTRPPTHTCSVTLWPERCTPRVPG